MNLAVYRMLSRCLSPAYRFYLWRLGRKNRAYRAGLQQRWGNYSARPPVPGAVWVHAASVGEVRAAQSLIDQLLNDDWPLFITTNTPTGLDTISRRYGARVESGYPPVDVPKAVDRFVDALSPAAAIFIELEIWPNRLATLAARNIPVALINARLSSTSLIRYQRFGALIRQSLQGITCICAQTEEDAGRFHNMAVPNRKIHITGNLKFDQAIDQSQVEAGWQLRGLIGRERPVWVAASVRQGEAAWIREAHEALLASFPDAMLIAVPRHPERFQWLDVDGEEVWDRHVIKASAPGEGSEPYRTAHVLLADTVGEMIKYLAAGDVSFVGGSLVPVGGHNPLEPAVLGKPVLMGPQVRNFQQVDELLASEGARFRVHDADELAESLEHLFRDRHVLDATGRNAQAVIEAHRGASTRTMKILEDTVLSGTRPETR
ncbi:3-deoxy-D-manno-octulosonic acid transferase [Spiribacter curvatus]|uniref:3-deoxy-D-manno-octulosonic acid transferase n=1 Tax=Spiribacter curvatus TaxID=1335757 RepID=UPI0011D20709|nr:3-deoxy-D-manno-octulosonic acid transferase [Spiribacter curvatus]